VEIVFGVFRWCYVVSSGEWLGIVFKSTESLSYASYFLLFVANYVS